MPSLDPAIAKIYDNCELKHHIGGLNYFAALKRKIDTLGTGDTSSQFIYMAGWRFQPAFTLDGRTRLVDMLIAKAKAGVDVRVLGWVLAPSIYANDRMAGASELADLMDTNAETMEFMNLLRAEPRLADKACLNILCHPAGAIHMKVALVGSAAGVTAFTGGIDCGVRRLKPEWQR
jgi:hypothetical protein